MKSKVVFRPLYIMMGCTFLLISSCQKTEIKKEISGGLTDIEGNVYSTVTIGSQVWMAENLKTSRFNDDSEIPEVKGFPEWTKLTTPAYCWMSNDEITYKNLYGALYNWFAVNSGKLCPTGWHVPSDGEFMALEETLGMSTDTVKIWDWRGLSTQTGTKLKSTTGWSSGGDGTNTSGFSALPGGYRYAITGSFNNAGDLSYWWTSTEESTGMARYRRLDWNSKGVFRGAVNEQGGKYVRCVKD